MTDTQEGSRPARGRPRVTINIAASADGKIAPVDKGKVNFGGPEDRALMELLRSQADAVLIGAGTLRAEDPPLLIRDPALKRRRIEEKGAPHPPNITVSSILPEKLAEMKFFTSPETEKIVFTTEKTPAERRAAAEKFARVEVVPTNTAGHVDLLAVIRRLSELGINRLLLEGGGELNFSMLELGVVDEIYLTVCPFIFGGRDASTPVDGAGFTGANIRNLALASVRQGQDGVIFLHYHVLPDTTES